MQSSDQTLQPEVEITKTDLVNKTATDCSSTAAEALRVIDSVIEAMLKVAAELGY